MCRRRLLETQFAFQEATGHSSAAYRKLFGAVQHQRKQLEVLTDTLGNNEKGCIIICGTEAMDRSCQGLLKDYCRSHPVVHIVRDDESIHSYLRTLGHEKVRDLIRVSSTAFRSCSNFEFFNASDGKKGDGSTNRFHSPFLNLKKAERHFLKFIALVTEGSSTSHVDAAYTLSNIPVELRRFTYAVSIPLTELSKGDTDVEQLEAGSDAFEIVIDESLGDQRSTTFQRINEAFAAIRRSCVVPLIYHVDRSRVASCDYPDLVRHGLRLAPEFLTVDLDMEERDLLDIIGSKGSTKIIGQVSDQSSTAPTWDEPVWMAAYKRAIDLGCDVVRMSRPATRSDDNFAIQRFRDSVLAAGGRKIPLISYNTGPGGRTSVVFNTTISPVTHDSIRQKQNGLTSSLTARDCTEALTKAFVYEPMNFYILGGMVSYSLSPAMHNAAYKLCGLPHKYQICQTSTLKDLHALVEDPNFGGASVTLPFKLEIISVTHSLTKHARAVGAVNTLIPVRELKEDGSIPDDLSLLREANRAGPVKALLGENTDWIGHRACIRRGLSPVNAVRPQSTAVVIGAGGMARAAIYALLQLGVKNIFIHNRTLAKAEQLADYYRQLVSGADKRMDPPSKKDFGDAKIHVLESRESPWPSAYRQPTILVSCIPSHSTGDSPVPHSTMPSQWLKSPTGGVVLEVGYRSLHTPLLEQIRAEAHKGWVAMDGLDLLPEQAFAQFEAFTGRRAPRRLMREETLRKYRDGLGVQDPELIQSRLAQINEQEP